MNQLQVFKNPEFGSVRTVTFDNEPWFVGKDVAEALGYENSTKAIRDHVDKEDKKMGVQNVTPSVTDNMGRLQYPTWISESGLYSLILSSKLPKAREFKRWVTSEVLPSIRKNGGYINGQYEMAAEELMARALEVSRRILQEKEALISDLSVQNAILQPKADYFDALVERNTLTSFRDTAKQLGVKERAFVCFLIDKKYIFRDRKGKLIPYADKNEGLFEVKECFNEKTQWAGIQTMITPKGRETFRLLCKGM